MSGQKSRMALKKHLRAEVFARLKKYDHIQRQFEECVVIEKLLRVIAAIHKPGLNIGVYSPLSEEVNIEPIFTLLCQMGHRLYFPIMSIEVPRLKFIYQVPDLIGEYRMGFRKTAFGVYEPSVSLNTKAIHIKPLKLDVVIVHGLVFDHRGMRLGRGKGYYDEFLGFAKKALTIAPIYETQWVTKVPCDSWDFQIDCILSCQKEFFRD